MTTEIRNNLFNRDNTVPINQQEFDALLGYFLKRGFDRIPATEISGILIEQAYADNVKVFTLIDTLKGTTDVELNTVVSGIINSTKSKTSRLSVIPVKQQVGYDLRNIESYQDIGKKFIETEIEPFKVAEIVDDQPYVEPGYVDAGYVEE